MTLEEITVAMAQGTIASGQPLVGAYAVRDAIEIMNALSEWEDQNPGMTRHSEASRTPREPG